MPKLLEIEMRQCVFAKLYLTQFHFRFRAMLFVSWTDLPDGQADGVVARPVDRVGVEQRGQPCKNRPDGLVTLSRIMHQL